MEATDLLLAVVAVCSEHGNEPSGSIRGGGIS